MKVIETPLSGALIVEPARFGDRRGFFMETYHKERYAEAGIIAEFVQDNLSFSVRGTLRGLHFQHPNDQAKLVQVIDGTIYDVAVDIRRNSPTFGQWFGVTLSGENHRQFFIPEGFAHGFSVLSATATFSYKCGDLYAPECEGGILWSDPDLAIDWKVSSPLLSEKDKNYPRLKDIPEAKLPVLGGLR